MEIGGLKYSGMTESMTYAIYDITQILYELERQTKKGLWGGQAKQTPGDGTKRCWNSDVFFLNRGQSRRC